MDRTELRDILVKYFSDSELADLCFELDIPYEDLGGSGTGKMTRAMNLVEYSERHSKTNELEAAVRRKRPELFEGAISPRLAADLDASVIGVCDTNGRLVGTGFAVSARLILTCAHVVDAAGSGPGQTLRVRFHANGETREVRVSADFWQPPDGDDIAALRLSNDAPAVVKPVVVGDAADSKGHRFHAFGYPEVGDVQGIWASGTIEGMVRDTSERQMIQLTSQNLAQGISGAPVLDETTQQVVGMVTSVYIPDATMKHHDTGFATPAETLRHAFPDLPRPR